MQPECLDRIFNPKMEFYRETYKDSIRWDGFESLNNKDIIVYCEQGFGDIIQFARYFEELSKRNCRIHLHAPIELHELLLSHVRGVTSVFDKECQELPKHDFHTLSMSLPFVLSTVDVPIPYITTTDYGIESDKFKIGIAWEGNPVHSNNHERCCPLGIFKKLELNPNIELYMLKKEIHNPKYVEGCEDFKLFGVELNSFLDTAKLIQSMELIISIDTSVLHLAGAMGKNTFAILGKRRDPRWNVGVNWYPTMKIIDYEDDWNEVASQINMSVAMELNKLKNSNA